MPRHKEPHYFLYGIEEEPFTTPVALARFGRHPFQTSWSGYQALFAEAGEARAIGEASVQYFAHVPAPSAIKSRCPDAKIIIMLRDPADRAYSAYNYQKMRGFEPLDSFEEALDAEPGRCSHRIAYGWRYQNSGRYATHLKRWCEVFGQENVKVVFFEDFGSNQLVVLQDIFAFLDIERSFVPENTEAKNVTTAPNKSRKALQRILASNSVPVRIGRNVSRMLIPEKVRDTIIAAMLEWHPFGQPERPLRMKASTRARLVHALREEILELQDLTGRDLSSWMK